MVSFIQPLRQKALILQNDPVLIADVLAQGASKARKSAAATLLKVREAMGF